MIIAPPPPPEVTRDGSGSQIRCEFYGPRLTLSLTQRRRAVRPDAVRVRERVRTSHPSEVAQLIFARDTYVRSPSVIQSC